MSGHVQIESAVAGKTTSGKPAVLIYRSELLAYSETFIQAQAAALQTFTPVFAGLRRVTRSLTLPAKSFVVSEDESLRSRLQRYGFLQSGYAPHLLASLRAEAPVLVHAHFAVDAAEALPISRALQIPMAVTLHGYDVMAGDQAHQLTRRGRIYLARRQRLFREASLFLCVSEAVRCKAMERGYPAAKLLVLPIGIDVAQYQPAPTLTAAPAVLFVGRLVEKKGCVHLIHAMCEVRRILPEARLVVIGDGPERASLEAEARRWGSQTIFLGVQSREQVRQWMHASRVLAVPSITAANGDAEGLPTVLYEALATGLPVACFRTSGIPELIRHGFEGLLAEEGDEGTLAQHLLSICQEDGLAARLGRAGRSRVQTSFDLGAQTARLERIYEQVLACPVSETLPSEARSPAQPVPAGIARQLAPVPNPRPAAASQQALTDARSPEPRSPEPKFAEPRPAQLRDIHTLTARAASKLLERKDAR